MMKCISIQQPPDHPLVLGTVLCSLALEELDAALRQSYRYFYSLLTESKLFRGRQKIRNDP